MSDQVVPAWGEAARPSIALSAMRAPLDVVQVAFDLMRIDSTSGREGDVIAFADRLLAGRGWHTVRIPVTPGRDDLLATSSDTPLVTLSTHLDTVPPFIAPARTETRLAGRGACDAKGIAAAMICAAERLRDTGFGVALLFVVGEETCHDGAHAANDAHRRGLVPATSRALINGEPTASTLALGTKGAVRMTLRTSGRAAHSAYPHLGQSATLDLVRLLAELETLDLPRDAVLGETTINIGMLSGGVADNVIAPSAEARIMARLVGPADDVVARVRRWVGDRAQVDVGVSVPPVHLKTVPGVATSVVAFATDIPALTQWGEPYLFGPGSVHVAHTDHEFIEIAELRAAVDAYEQIALSAVGRR
ncbi:MAG: peptidase [Geminicoccaceae bacterium]|nr:peptidase [Geminicoccaceae bacterium]